jgi:hypothetical protein
MPLKDWIEKNNSTLNKETVAHGFLNLYFKEYSLQYKTSNF